MADLPLVTYLVAGLALFLLVTFLRRSKIPNVCIPGPFCISSLSIPLQLDHVPSVGQSGRFTSYIVALRYLRHSWKVTMEGYQQVLLNGSH